MKINFTKMQGTGNDFVVLDETRGELGLSAADYRRLSDRHFGIGADQVLSVRMASSPQVDFDYVIHNNDGSEVEQCGNGARCFVRFVRHHGLTHKTSIRVKTKSGIITLSEAADQQVTVDMGRPIFEHAQIPYLAPLGKTPWDYVVSMGNPHAVCLVDQVETAPVLTLGPSIQANPAFAQGVNVGFMEVVNRQEIKLRVFERGAGETLACGTGACAAVVSGIMLGQLDEVVLVRTSGGHLQIRWHRSDSSVLMTGSAVIVFEGTIEL